MSYVKLDDTFFRHPKVLKVSKDAKILAVAGICYCGNQLTDGFIPGGAALVIAAETGVGRPKVAIAELVSSGLWDAVDGGYSAHDYLDYNTSSGKVRADREAAKERMRGKRSPEVPANNERSSPEVRQPTTTTTTEGSYEPIGSTEPDVPSDAPKLDDDPQYQPSETQPYDLLDALCAEIGTDPSVLSKQDKNKQLAVAKRLVEGSATVPELREITKWLKAQTWLTSGIDLFLIEKQISKWRMNGRPKGPPSTNESTSDWIQNGAVAPELRRVS